jgi:hypothetical protein
VRGTWPVRGGRRALEVRGTWPVRGGRRRLARARRFEGRTEAAAESMRPQKKHGYEKPRYFQEEPLTGEGGRHLEAGSESQGVCQSLPESECQKVSRSVSRSVSRNVSRNVSRSEGVCRGVSQCQKVSEWGVRVYPSVSQCIRVRVYSVSQCLRRWIKVSQSASEGVTVYVCHI